MTTVPQTCLNVSCSHTKMEYKPEGHNKTYAWLVVILCPICITPKFICKGDCRIRDGRKNHFYRNMKRVLSNRPNLPSLIHIQPNKGTMILLISIHFPLWVWKVAKLTRYPYHFLPQRTMMMVFTIVVLLVVWIRNQEPPTPTQNHHYPYARMNLGCRKHRTSLYRKQPTH
jgi:hypothetical protein